MSAGPAGWSIPLDRLGERPTPAEGGADAAARCEAARALGLRALSRLDWQVGLRLEGGRAIAQGRLVAQGEQRCALSDEAVPFALDAPVLLMFAPMPRGGDERELAADDLELFPHDGRQLPLGEAMVEALADLLPPRPLADAQALAEARRHLVDEDRAARDEAAARNPFGRLSG